jgi:cystathionine beta-lyase
MYAYVIFAAREFPEDLVRLSIGIESAEDLIDDLKNAIASFGKSKV